ncbi:hypothetical protein [Mycobacterium talmoniae]|uniref:Uncharacterized protein n=1 Tax=Mycobacterium talmoniae TaxID=1858794 RepID=A0A1S1NPP8_9MYCO|nr:MULTISPECIES: hypothetical protein [Mycobacterium]OHV04765.1 hypothetical protein BKN37_08575 [Mycobacterium talmoniae]PQM46334.1 hypothetical protein C1Y40_03497 [Mycobacterium talmoniae]TDH51897.1 hypothetical protein E2F47_15280 [Mycobacterium eburneum]
MSQHAKPESLRNVVVFVLQMLFISTVVMGEILGGFAMFAISVDHLHSPPPVACHHTVMAADDGCVFTGSGKTHTERLLPHAFADRTPPTVRGGAVHDLPSVAAYRHQMRVWGTIFGPLLFALGVFSAVAFTRARRHADNPVRAYLAQRGPNWRSPASPRPGTM